MALLAKPTNTTGDLGTVAVLADLLTEEVSNRRRLERRLAALQNQVRQLQTAVANGSCESSSEEEAHKVGKKETAEDPEKVSEARFLAVGFDATSRTQLKKRASKIEMERLYLRHQARREG